MTIMINYKKPDTLPCLQEKIPTNQRGATLPCLGEELPTNQRGTVLRINLLQEDSYLPIQTTEHEHAAHKNVDT